MRISAAVALPVVSLLACLSPAWGQALSNADCLGCHADASLTKDTPSGPVTMHVDEAAFGSSVHSVLSCTDCHADITAYPHEPTPAKVDCGTCHTDATAAYQASLHARAIEQGRTKAATCAGCHGNPHAIVASSDPKSRTNHANIPKTCGSCHGVKFVMETSGLADRPFYMYQESVHGRAIARGSAKAAVCTDCHGSHDIRDPKDSASLINKFNVPQTCGRCHEAISHEYARSVHGTSVARGNWQSPVCTDCHGVHTISAAAGATAANGGRKGGANGSTPLYSCADCHDSVRLSREFGIAGDRSRTYEGTYHGLAAQLGADTVANCASCHGIHDILPSSDPRSRIHEANLASTCGACHAGATANFAKGAVHTGGGIDDDDNALGATVNAWVRTLYIWLIVVVIGGMILHNLLAWRKAAVLKRKHEPRTVVRMTKRQRIQHMVLLISFLTLVWSGFALVYPDSWVSWTLGSSEDVRRIVHRTAGVVMLLVSLYHVFYLLVTREGRQVLRDFVPTFKDIKDLGQNLRYWTGRSPQRAKFGRFGYPEKAEYWALVWGVIIMGLTGFMAWFSVWFSNFMPRWVIDVAITIHLYEAILASLAILVWHFYGVIFDPDVYPMNWAWFDGRVSREWYQHEHPLDTAALGTAAPTHEPGPSGAPGAVTGMARESGTDELP